MAETSEPAPEPALFQAMMIAALHRRLRVAEMQSAAGGEPGLFTSEPSLERDRGFDTAERVRMRRLRMLASSGGRRDADPPPSAGAQPEGE